MDYLYYDNMVIPIGEIERIFKSDIYIFIQTEDKEVFRLKFDNEPHRDAAYVEIYSLIVSQDIDNY